MAHWLQPAEPTLETHHTVSELATLWHLDARVIRRLFRGEPGVLAIQSSRRGRKRDYVSVRIPTSVAARVYCRLTTPLSAISERATLTTKPPREPLETRNMARKRGQQTGHLHKQGNWWYLAYREDELDAEGNIVRSRRNKKLALIKEVSKREAQRLAREILNVVDEQALTPASLMTVEEFVKERFEVDHVWALKSAGKQHYAYVLNHHVLPEIGSMRIRDVRNQVIQALIRKKANAGYSSQTLKHIRNTVSTVFNHAISAQTFTGLNPAKGVKIPEGHVKETHALTFDQARSVLAALPSPVKEMVLISTTCSLNVAELLGLRRKYLNLTNKSVVVGSEVLQPFTLAVRENCYRGKFGSVKAKSRRRAVPLPERAVDLLEQYLATVARKAPDDLVFSTCGGTPLDECNLARRVLKPVGKALGMPWLSWHVFRHTHSTLGEQIGMSLSDRQAQMGHADVRMTMHYTHSDLERRRKSIDDLADKLIQVSDSKAIDTK